MHVKIKLIVNVKLNQMRLHLPYRNYYKNV